jgi:hypothetical protein
MPNCSKETFSQDGMPPYTKGERTNTSASVLRDDMRCFRIEPPEASMSEPFPMDPEALAAAIDIPLSEWPGNCHGIAEAIRDLVPVEGLRIARGHWLGDVGRDSVYRNAPIQHSWLVAPDGRILDPTRWAIVSPSKPSIYLGISDEYDEGGRFLTTRRGPSFPGTKDPHVTMVEKMGESDRAELAAVLNHGSTDPRRLGESLTYVLKDDTDRIPGASKLFAILERTGNKGWIPIDSWMRVMEPDKLACRAGSNRKFVLPEAPVLTDTRALFEVFNKFLTIEERPDIESELEDFGYDLQRDLWRSLNEMERWTNMPIAHLPRQMCDTLSVIAGELLGKGFGEEMRVDRFATSIGVPPSRLAALMREFGNRSGYNLDWDVANDRREEKHPEDDEEASAGMRF